MPLQDDMLRANRGAQFSRVRRSDCALRMAFGVESGIPPLFLTACSFPWDLQALVRLPPTRVSVTGRKSWPGIGLLTDRGVGSI